MIRRRGITRRATAVAAVLAVGAAGGAAGVASAGTLNTSKGGYRDVASNGDTTFAFGLQGAIMQSATNSTFTSGLQDFPATDATGATSISGISGTRYVREKTSPAGWEPLPTLNWDGGPKPYVGTANVPSSGSATARIDARNGNMIDARFVNRLKNPALPQASCGKGIRVLLLLDTSGSTSGYNDAYNAAAKTFINTLAGTPTSLKIASFATNSTPATTPYDLSTPAGQSAALTKVNSIYPNNTSGSGFTNWDAALKDAATTDVDVIVFVTDGNPTVRAGSTGSATDDLRNVTFGIASANLAKDPDRTPGGLQQTMMAVGVGTDIAIDNLKAVSGPNEGSDWTAASDPSALAAALKKIAEAICPTDLAIVKKGDATVAPNGTINYDLTVTNNGAVEIPFTSIKVTDPGATIVPPAPQPLGPGKSLVWKATRVADTKDCASEFPNTATVELVNLPGYAEQDLTNNTSTWKTVIVCPVDFSIAKQGDVQILPGGVIKYGIAVKNTGNFAAPFGSIKVTDPNADPGSLKYDKPDPAPVSLAVGESAFWTATQTVPKSEDLCGKQVINTATVAFLKTPGFDDPTGPASSTVTTNVICPLKVSIAKSSTNGPIAPGDIATYDVVVMNAGDFTIPFDQIVVTDPGATLTPPADTRALAPGATRTWKATKQVPNDQECGVDLENTATVSLKDSQPTAVAPSEAVGGTSSTAYMSIVCPVELSIVKDGDATVLAGDVIKYGITVKNTGKYPVPFSSIKVTDPDADPGSLTYAGSDPAPKFLMPGDTLLWTATRKAGSSAEVCGSSIDNTATVGLLTTPGYTDPTGPASSKFTTTVNCPVKFSITKTSDPTVLAGGTITYGISVQNAGNYPIPFSAIEVSDPDADEGSLKYVGPEPPPEFLMPGDTLPWTATRTAGTSEAVCGSPVENTASVGLIKAPGYVDPSGGDSSTAVTIINCPVEVSITKSTGQATVTPGGVVTYDVIVTNPTDYVVPFSSIVVTDDGATLTPPADTSDLGPGATRTWVATKAVASDAALCGTPVTNTASVALADLPTGLVNDLAPSSASASPVTVSGGICTPVTPAAAPVAFRPAGPALSVTKTGPARMLAGGRVGYRITVTNTGATEATNVVLRDQAPGVFTVASRPAGSTVSGRTTNWNIGTLAAGQSVTKTVRFVARRTAKGRACNVALVSATGVDTARARACTTIVAARRPATPVTG